MSQIETLAATVSAVALPGLKPKQIIAEVRHRHPKATKKDVVRAAFYALTGADRLDGEKVKALHDLAITQRAPGDEDKVASPKPERSKKQEKLASRLLP